MPEPDFNYVKLYALTDGIDIWAVKAMTLKEFKQAQNIACKDTKYYRTWRLLSESDYVGHTKEMK